MRRIVALIGALTLVASLPACTQDSNSVAAQAKAGDQKGYISGDGTIERIPADSRDEPVTLEGTTLDGDQWSASTARGKVVVINVWGSWCPPCQAEAPELNAVMTAYADAGRPVVFMGINERDNPASARAAEKSFPVEFPSLDNSGGLLLLQLQGKASTTPGTLVLDTEGRIAARVGGGTTKATLTGLVDDVLAES